MIRAQPANFGATHSPPEGVLLPNMSQRRSAGWTLLFLAIGAWIGSLHAQEGSRAWPAPFTVGGFISSSPAVTDDGSTIYVGVEAQTGGGRVFAITRDGARKWVTPDTLAMGAVSSSPAIGPDGTVYVGSADGRLYALNGDTGAVRWRYNADSFISSSPAIGEDGTVYVGSGDGKLHAVIDNGSAGTARWVFNAGTAAEPTIIESSPAIAGDGTIYVGAYNRFLFAVHPSGVERWRFATGGPIYASPAIGRDGTIYVGSALRVHAITPEGTPKWNEPFLTNGDLQSSPVLGADGTVYVASSDTFLYALRPTDGTELWRTQFGTTTASTPAIRGDGVIIFGGDDNKVRAINLDTHTERWKFSGVQGDDDYIESSPVVASDGGIYVGSSDGFLYKLVGTRSPLSALSSWPAFRRDARHTARAPKPTDGGQLVNLSTRAQVAGSETLIAGFVVQGTGQRAYLLRGIGPTLAQFGLAGMPDPELQIFSGRLPFAGNDDWGVRPQGGFGPADVGEVVGAFPLPAGSKDAAVVPVLPSGSYTVHLTSVDGRGGVVLLEAYDTPVGDPMRLVNLSTRGEVGVGANAIIAGVVVGGTQPTRLLLRGIGPALSQFGVGRPLAQPTITFLERRGAEQVVIATNTGWTSDGFKYDLEAASAMTSAFALPAGSADSAMVVTVNPGQYTLQLSGVGGTTGEGLVEIYVLP
jgi:outer membrane protein assembly factor BamB